MCEPHRILFTGISGIGIRSAVKKLASYVAGPPLKRDVSVVEAEEHLYDVVRELGLLRTTSYEAEATIQSLTLPKPLLRRCWESAFRRSVDKHSIGTTTADVFLHAHVCFYHQKTREFFTLLDPDLLKEHFCPEAVVTLVDDIENIHERLRDAGEMFDKLDYDYHGLVGLARACQNHSTLMHWRAAEFSAAEQLALQLKCPHLLLAVKHPLETAANLIYHKELPRIYISHPISKPRRQLAAGRADQFHIFAKELRRVCDILRRHAVLFEPTTIDEFRFSSSQAKGGSQEPTYLPVLTPRWPLPDEPDNLLWTPLDAEDPNPIDPFDQFDSKQVDRLNESTEEAGESDTDLRELEVASALTGALVGVIEDQVAARDLKLVQQSPVLLVIRPLYSGNASGGVKEEIRFHCQLVNAGLLPNAKIWIFTTKDDERCYRVNSATTWLASKIDEKIDDELLGALRSDVDKIEFATATPDLVDALLRVALRHDKRIPKRPPKPLNGTPRGAAIEEKQRLLSELEEKLRFPYQDEIDSYGDRIEHEVRYGDSWPTADLLNELIMEEHNAI